MDCATLMKHQVLYRLEVRPLNVKCLELGCICLGIYLGIFSGKAPVSWYSTKGNDRGTSGNVELVEALRNQLLDVMRVEAHRYRFSETRKLQIIHIPKSDRREDIGLNRLEPA